MSSTVLYRKHRPSSWREVIGQDHIVKLLADSVNSGKISHAYLFSGSRGTGKTSVARILAQSLKISIEDITEIDAASNRGIDDIKALREHVSVLPFSSKYKVYIIDEVHMLSKDAWNALLKTLEEPPAHVIFILATTELAKVPDTIISRCQAFVFRKPSRDLLRTHLEEIAIKEKYTLDPGAADLIALLSEGSFRDALGILEQVMASVTGSKISRQDVESVTGAPRAELANRFIEGLLAKDSEVSLGALAQAEKLGVSMTTFMTLILETARSILLVQHAPNLSQTVQDRVSADDWSFISAQARLKVMTPSTLVILL